MRINNTKGSDAPTRTIIWTLILIGWIFRLCDPLIENPLNYQYSDMARHWKNGETLWTHPGYPSAIDPLGFQLFLNILQTITQENPSLVGLTFGVLSILFTWFFYQAARTLSLDRKASSTFLLLLVWTPSLFSIFHYTVAETLTLTSLGFSAWMTARTIKKLSWVRFAIMVAAWSIAVQIKSILLPVALVSCLFVWLQLDMKIFYAGLGASIFGLFLLPNIIRTEYLMGYAAPLGSSWEIRLQLESKCRELDLNWGRGHYKFGSPSSYIEPLWPLSHWSTSRNLTRIIYTVTVDPAFGERDWIAAEKKLSYSWEDSLNDRIENTIFLLFAQPWPESNFDTVEGWIIYWSRWVWGPLIFYAMSNNVRSFWIKRFEYIPVITTAFFLFLLFQNVAPMEGRYRKPLEPLLIFNAMTIVASRSSTKKEAKSLPQLIDDSKSSNPS